MPLQRQHRETALISISFCLSCQIVLNFRPPCNGKLFHCWSLRSASPLCRSYQLWTLITALLTGFQEDQDAVLASLMIGLLAKLFTFSLMPLDFFWTPALIDVSYILCCTHYLWKTTNSKQLQLWTATNQPSLYSLNQTWRILLLPLTSRQTWIRKCFERVSDRSPSTLVTLTVLSLSLKEVIL